MKNMTKLPHLTFILLCYILYTVTAFATNTRQAEERAIITETAREYTLTTEETRLLKVIRIIENGPQGREFGVLTPKAMRYADHPNWRKSFRVQAQWAAGTIKKRYNGNLKTFADRWCPIGAKNDPTGLNKNWYPNAKYWMNKLGGRK
jgi:hypothetical protein